MPRAAGPFAALQQQRMRHLYQEQYRSSTDDARREEDSEDVGQSGEHQGQQPDLGSTHGYQIPGRQMTCAEHNSSYKSSFLRRSVLIQNLRPAAVELQRLPVPQHPEPGVGPDPAAPGVRRSGLPWANLAKRCHALAEEEQYGQDMHDASSGRGGGSGHSSPGEYRSADEQEAGEEDGEQDGDEVSSEDDEDGWEDSRLYWEEAIGTKLWASGINAAGWDALRGELHREATFLPVARVQLCEAGRDLGQPTRDPSALIVALAEQQRRDGELAAPMVQELRQLLRDAAVKVDAMDPDQMEKAMRQCAEELPLALTSLKYGVLPSGVRRPLWEDLSKAQQSVGDVSEEVERGHALAGVLRRHWPQLLLDEGEGGHAGAAAWRRMVEAAEAQPGPTAPQQVLLQVVQGLLLVRLAAIPLYDMLEPSWHTGARDPCYMAALDALYRSLQTAAEASGGQLALGDLPPAPLVYWLLSKVPPEALQLLRAWPHTDTDPQAAPRPPPARLSPDHLELAARVVMEQPLGVLCAVALAGWWGSSEQQGAGAGGTSSAGGAGQPLSEQDSRWLLGITWKAALGAELLRREWKGARRGEGGKEQGRARTTQHTESTQRQQRQERQTQEPSQRAAVTLTSRAEPQARVAAGEGAYGPGPAPAPFPAPAGDPWVGPRALPRLQLALQALAEYGWLEEPYGCTNTECTDEWQVLCDHLGRKGMQLLALGECEDGREAMEERADYVGDLAAELMEALEAQVRNSAALEALGRHAATAALHDARSAALCVRGAPLSGCQLRGVVEALRPGLLAAHPGTWGAAVRRAEEREQRGEPEDTRLMLLLRSAVACLAAAEPFCGLATLLPTEGLGLAPCALAGILLAAAEQASYSPLPQRHSEHLRHCTLAVLVLMHLAHVPYELCHTAVQLMAAQPPHHDTAHLPFTPGPNRGRDAADTYGTYLRLALYDMPCAALAVMTALGKYGCTRALYPHGDIPPVEEAADGVAFLAAVNSSLRSGAQGPGFFVPGTQPGAAGQQQPPPATWHDLQQAHAAAVQQAAVAHMLGGLSLAPRTAGGSGWDSEAQAAVLYMSVSNASPVVLEVKAVLDSWGLVSRPWGEQVGNEVAGVLLAPLLYGKWEGDVKAVVRGGEAMALLLVALVAKTDVLTPSLRPQLPPHAAGRQGDPLLHGALGPCSHQEDDEDGEDEGSGRLEAAAAASTLCLEMRAGAWLRRDSKLAKLYPAWADMTRGTVHVDTSSSWGSLYSALRTPFFGKRACRLTWVMAQGVAGTVRALMLLAKLREEMNAAGREVNVFVTGVKLEQCKRQLEEMKKEQQQQKQQADRAGAAAARQAGAQRIADAEADLGVMAKLIEALPARLQGMCLLDGVRSGTVLDFHAACGDARPVKPQSEEEWNALERAVKALGMVVRQLTKEGGIVRNHVRIEMQVAEVEAGGWDKLVPPAGGREGREGKGAGAGSRGNAGGGQGSSKPKR